MEAIALKESTFMSVLLLQKPHPKSKPRDHTHTNCLKRRLEEWCKGKTSDLLNEGKAIQHRLPKSMNNSQDSED